MDDVIVDGAVIAFSVIPGEAIANLNLPSGTTAASASGETPSIALARLIEGFVGTDEDEKSPDTPGPPTKAPTPTPPKRP